MPMPNANVTVEDFIARWDKTAKAERANFQPFISELCDLLAVERPHPAVGTVGHYRFERPVTHHNPDDTTAPRFIDLYRRGHFVLEAKQAANEVPAQMPLFGKAEAEQRATVRQSKGWVEAMLRAKGQAEGYARDLPKDEGYPPFLIVCDVGFCFDLYADFSGLAKHYAQFPDREIFVFTSRT